MLREVAYAESVDGSDEDFCFVSLVNGDTVARDHKMESEEGRNDTKRVNGPVFLEDFNNEVIGLYISTHAEKIVCSSAEDNWRIEKESTVDGMIRSIWEKGKVIEDDRFDVLLPFEAGVDTTLHEAIHGNG